MYIYIHTYVISHIKANAHVSKQFYNSRIVLECNISKSVEISRIEKKKKIKRFISKIPDLFPN